MISESVAWEINMLYVMSLNNIDELNGFVSFVYYCTVFFLIGLAISGTFRTNLGHIIGQN